MSEPDVVQIAVTRNWMTFIENCLKLRGMVLYPIPTGEDDLPTYSIGPAS